MCLLDYNKKTIKYKHLTYTERTMIERWYNKEKLSKKEIAERLNKSERTIRREIKRGLTTNLTSQLIEIKGFILKKQIDKRTNLIELTNKGEKILEESALTIKTFRENLSSKLDENEINKIVELLEKVASSVKE